MRDAAKHDVPTPADGEFIFRKTIKLKNGRVLHAHMYGLNAFRIRLRGKPKAD
jgi:hypothetical protein